MFINHSDITTNFSDLCVKILLSYQIISISRINESFREFKKFAISL